MLASDKEWQEGSIDPLEWCRKKQDECLDNNDEKGAMVYYELAQLWMKRRDESGEV